MRTTTQRGYGAHHQALRKKLTPTVDAGQAHCTEPICLEQLDGRSRWIQPGTPWDLAHNRDAGPGIYRGPAHRRCNRTEGTRWAQHLRLQAHATRHWVIP